MNEAEKVDVMLWELVGKAHELNEVKFEKYYPELKLFIEYLINHYPAKEPNEIVQTPHRNRCPHRN